MSVENKMKKFYKKPIPKKGVNFKGIDKTMTIKNFKKELEGCKI